ncbi:hypothetical protein E2C01_029201 [Portunus trituberculatus]|uniref:Uncharacterized protein n=1 Tax=Portunus trituberculatus TaxID=210409 RepID=A0A5B7ERC0_PORTR|nr:hypothetical protein [Portunus trituberculatus]
MSSIRAENRRLGRIVLNQKGEEGREGEACVVKRLKFEELKKSKQKSDNLNGWNARSGKKKSEGRSERKEDSGVHTGCVQKGIYLRSRWNLRGKKVKGVKGWRQQCRESIRQTPRYSSDGDSLAQQREDGL